MIRGSQCPSGGSRAFKLAGVVLLVLLAGSLVLPQAAGAAETWRVTGPLVTGRYGHTATLLPNGKVLVAGGYNGVALTSSELYDPAAGTWSPTTGSLSVGRWNHTATLLPNGKVLVAGGGPTQCELYDPDEKTWSTTGAGTLTDSRSNHTATLLDTGKVLVAGGAYITYLNSAELYDPGTGQWGPTPSLTNGRYSHTATLLNTGKVLVVGGHGSNNAPVSAELYDPAGEGSWSATGSLTPGRAQHTATLLPSGQVLVAGGYDEGNEIVLTSAKLYDPAANEGVGAWSDTDALLQSRLGHTATLLPSGKVLVAAGLNGFWPSSPTWLSSAELYDPAAGTWSAIASLTVKRSAHTATLLNSGQVLAAGGMDNTFPLRSAELYPHPDITGVLYLLLLN